MKEKGKKDEVRSWSQELDYSIGRRLVSYGDAQMCQKKQDGD